jgi:glycosyltransferase involved in cell wall biosynthesis
MQKNILIIGYFGYVTNQLDGQTIKTRNVFDLIKRNVGNEYTLDLVDTQKLKTKPLITLFKLLFKPLKSKVIFYLPGESNLNKYFPILYYISKLARIEIIYPVVGGWLPSFLTTHCHLITKLKTIKAILVESERMNNELFNMGFRNVSILENFRIINKQPFVKRSTSEHLKFVFMSRVRPDKGCNIIFDALEQLKINGHFTVDFYGEIAKDYETEFLSKVSKHSNTSYRGIIQPTDVFLTLTRYDILLLPTYYDGEGFPGTIVESFMSGLPVIVSDWKDLASFISDGENGFVIPPHNANALADRISYLVQNPEVLVPMKENALKSSLKFSESNAWLVVKSVMKQNNICEQLPPPQQYNNQCVSSLCGGLRICVLGYFGYVTNQLDGQTVKTRDIYKLVKQQYPNSIVTYYDTQQFQSNRWSLLKMFKDVCRARQLVYLPANNNLKYIFPILFVLSHIFRFDINYYVVGGWLSSYIKNLPVHRQMLKRIKGIHCETQRLKTDLETLYGFTNVDIFPNFRFFHFTPKRVCSNKLRLVFMARIMLQKGLDWIFNLADYIVSHDLYDKISITFYGQINESDKDYFLENVSKYDFVDYGGALQPNEIYETLCQYDCMLLPTHFYTEGLPGSIVDAYISGIPVIATNWINAMEFIDNGKSGYIIPFDNGKDELIASVLKLYNDRKLLQSMQYYVLRKRIQFAPPKINF